MIPNLAREQPNGFYQGLHDLADKDQPLPEPVSNSALPVRCFSPATDPPSPLCCRWPSEVETLIHVGDASSDSRFRSQLSVVRRRSSYWHQDPHADMGEMTTEDFTQIPLKGETRKRSSV